MITKRTESGFTLIELLITIVVIAVLVALAAPSFTTTILNQRSDGLSEDLASALQLAKTEAVKRGSRVSLCAANEGGDDCGNDWTDGWLVFVDSASTDESAAAVLGSADDIIRSFDAPHEKSNITATKGGAISFVRYTNTGQLARIGGVSPAVFDVYVTGCKGERRRTINVGVAGMMDIQRSECPEA